jgi:cobaltochelatase CobT
VILPDLITPLASSSVARQQQKLHELCAVAIRALSGQADLHFRARRLHRREQVLPLFGPHLQPRHDEDEVASYRGVADAIALRLLHSDAALHEQLCPAETVQRWVFELLEQFRVESFAPVLMLGVVRNVREGFERWVASFAGSGMTETSRGLLLFAVALIARVRVNGQSLTDHTADMIEGTRAQIIPWIGHELAGLARHRGDQFAYAQHALALAQMVVDLLREAEGDESDSDQKEVQDQRQSRFVLLVDFDSDVADGINKVAANDSRILNESDQGYAIFTTSYDQQHNVADLVRPVQLAAHRERLDAQVAAQGVNINRLARHLKALLATPERDGWDDGQESGRIDGRRLAQLISSPTQRQIFRTETEQRHTDCVLSVLIDCSGSMKQHAPTVAVLIDVFSRALDLAGVNNEVLGFTTGAWNGGRARRDWLRARRPRYPGRLNELCHLVFKDANNPWRRARASIAGLLQSDLYREGVDGEAVNWAAGRLLNHDHARRRILIVVSDGCPMDSATALANDEHYLDHHLRQVVGQREQRDGIEIYGLGVGLDLSPYYRNSLALDWNAGLSSAAFFELVQMLASGKPKR